MKLSGTETSAVNVYGYSRPSFPLFQSTSGQPRPFTRTRRVAEYVWEAYVKVVYPTWVPTVFPQAYSGFDRPQTMPKSTQF